MIISVQTSDDDDIGFIINVGFKKRGREETQPRRVNQPTMLARIRGHWYIISFALSSFLSNFRSDYHYYFRFHFHSHSASSLEFGLRCSSVLIVIIFIRILMIIFRIGAGIGKPAFRHNLTRFERRKLPRMTPSGASASKQESAFTWSTWLDLTWSHPSRTVIKMLAES